MPPPSPITRTYRGTPRNLALLARKLAAGQLVAVPSETVYGLAGNALDAAACARIFRAKGRPHSDPLIVHIGELAQLTSVAQAGPVAQKLARSFWPGPLTLVLPKTDAVPPIVTAGRDTVAVRMPSHPLFLKLLAACQLPLAAPSANPFGYVSPTSAAHVKSGLGGKISAVLDGGLCQIGIESTILDARDEKHLRILRPGAISAEQVSKVAGRPVANFRAGLNVQSKRGAAESAAASAAAPPPPSATAEAGAHEAALPPAAKTLGEVAPGQLSRHYSPRARVILHDKIPAELARHPSAGEALLYFSKPSSTAPLDTTSSQAEAAPKNAMQRAQLTWLTATGSQSEAARQLFAKLRELDAQGFRSIHAELAPPGTLSAAINDRLRRAAAKA